MSEPSGPQWCQRFPTSVSPHDLLPDFRDSVLAFLSQLRTGGAAVSIAATYRPPERAYLMHWCWMIAKEGQDPRSVPAMAGVDIAWMHADGAGPSRDAAAAMAARYALKVRPSLTSRHTQRRAIDMSIAWHGTLTLRDFDAGLHRISSPPHDGTNPELADVGRSFGVIKLASDPPHWSDDGH